MQVNISSIAPGFYNAMYQYLHQPDIKPLWVMSMAGRTMLSVIFFHNTEDALVFKLKFGL